MTITSEKRDRILAYMLGVGLALFPIHWRDQPLKEWLFLPSIGISLIVCTVVLVFLLKTPHPRKWGSPWVLVPMAIILLSMGAGILVDHGTGKAATVMGILLFGVYISARELGVVVFRPISFAAIAVGAGAILQGIMYPGSGLGGLVTNYAAAAGYLVFGVILSRDKWRRWMLALTASAILLLGSLEGAFVLGVGGLVGIIRRDWSRWLLIPAVASLIAVSLVFVTGNADKTFRDAGRNIQALLTWEGGPTTVVWEGDIPLGGGPDRPIDTVTTSRWEVFQTALSDIKLLGHGYEVMKNTGRTVHNVPLIIVDQIGPLAGIAWLFVTVYCLVKTKWKYAWAGVLIMSVWDHYTWTQMAPWWWALAGVSTTVEIKNDYIFKESA